MEAIVLAGGKGARLGELSRETPKPMLPVGDKPFLEYILDYLYQEGVTHIVLSVGYLARKIIGYFGDNYKGVPITYSIETEPMGTGGAIRVSMEFAKEDEVIVLNGDTFFQINLNSVLDKHRHKGALLTMVLRYVDNCSRYGVALLEGDKVVGFKEKSAGGEALVNGGVYIVNRHAALELMPVKSHSFEIDFLPSMLSKDKVYAVINDEYFIDIGIPDDYQRARNEMIPDNL